MARSVGPFVFFDEMGPADFPAGQGINVRPHPHIGLATISYLFRGRMHHRDSLGTDKWIEPGAVNWMTAGSGIVHAEMFPLLHKDRDNPVELFQIWINLPAANKMVEPHFSMFWDGDVPRHTAPGVTVTVIAGELVAADGMSSSTSTPPTPRRWRSCWTSPAAGLTGARWPSTAQVRTCGSSGQATGRHATCGDRYRPPADAPSSQSTGRLCSCTPATPTTRPIAETRCW